MRALAAGLGALFLVACGGGGDGPAADAAPPDAAGTDAPVADASACDGAVFEDVAIPMRDGESLAAFVRRPSTPDCHVPTILIQTPYDKENARALWFADDAANPLFASRTYAFVVVDWRGFYGSAAAAVAGAQPWGPDGHDTVEWIAAQPWSDGQVGTWGVSALCVQQYRTAVERPPHLRAAVPIFCALNMTYEQYYPGGVLRREYVDTLGALFGTGSIIEEHPTRDAVWQYVEGLIDPARVEVPMLVVSGWYDLDGGDTLRSFEALRAESAAAVRDRHRLLIGDWHHFAAGGESTGGRPLTEQELKYWDAERRIQRDSLAFFDRELRGLDTDAAAWARVRYVVSGEGAWADTDAWPPAGTVATPLHLHADGTLAVAAPAAAELERPFDPDDPSPTIGGQTLSFSLAHGPHDQAEVIARADAAVFTTAPLAELLRVRGPISVELAVATTGADTDLAVRLTDVAPDGSHLLIGEGIHRLKLRESLATVSPVVPGQRYPVTVRLVNHLAYAFAPGHRVGLIVTSSNYPRFDRNPGTGADSYTDAASSEAVTNTIFCDGASRLLLPVD